VPEAVKKPPSAAAGGGASAKPGGGERRRGEEVDPAAGPQWSAWSNLWQMPVILISVALIGLGVYVGFTRGQVLDFDAALSQVEQFLSDGRLVQAEVRLRDVIEPQLGKAAPPQQARFHMAVADWLSLAQAQSAADQAAKGLPAMALEGPTANDRRIVEQYTLAVQGGISPNARQLQRWAQSLIALGELEPARDRLRELEHMAMQAHLDPTTREDAQIRRNQVLRLLVERSLRQTKLSLASLMQILADYRADRLLSVADETWAIARQAELRLESGEPEQAVDRLMVDMRRLEARVTASGSAPPPMGELYTLLGRAYFDLGRFDDATFALKRAMAFFSGPDPIRGQAIVIAAQIAQASGRLEEALDSFDMVVREYVNTLSHLPGVLGRAEVRGAMGNDAASLEDYRQVRDALLRAGALPRRDVTAQRVAQSLCDRHDAALVADKNDAALSCSLLAEELFPAGQTPSGVLLRVASTSRLIAGRIIAEALAAANDPSLRPDQLDAGIRAEANVHFKRAADYYLRHARMTAGSPTEDEIWADSLWLAADSYDLAGWRDQAITHFTEYLAGRSAADPRRAEATFRLAQAHQAEFQHPDAVRYYEQLLAEHPRSPFASASHVPLARCYLALEQPSQAERQLLAVVSGERYLEPEAVDYREALIELGRLYDRTGDAVRAIEHLTVASRRYAADPRIAEIRFRLADSHRAYADQLKEQSTSAALTIAERDERLAQRAAQLRIAMDLFTLVIDEFERMGARRMDSVQKDYLRGAHLARAGCAYDLELHDKAIELYDLAARKYADHVSSLMALVQIVNCYEAMGDSSRARAAHARALLRLQQLPDSAFQEPGAMMNRRAWEDWLRNVPPIGPMTASAGSGAEG
jgi:tetratricopeptide (TPR) repeat protein